MDVILDNVADIISMTVDCAYSFLKNVVFGFIILILIFKFIIENIKLDSTWYKYSYF